MTLLDLRPPSLTIKFNVGTTVSHTFFYVDSNFTPINISTYSARMKAKVSYTSTAILDLDTGIKGGLAVVGPLTTTLDDYLIVQGDKVINTGLVVTGCYGLKLTLTDTQTSLLTPELDLLFDIELVSPTPVVYPFIKGSLIPYNQVTN